MDGDPTADIEASDISLFMWARVCDGKFHSVYSRESVSQAAMTQLSVWAQGWTGSSQQGGHRAGGNLGPKAWLC